MEAGDPSVSLDLLVRGLFALGATREELAKLETDKRKTNCRPRGKAWQS
jgi:hypothetical protein